MFAALGDQQKQTEIRQATPEAKHCSFLRASSIACAELPYQIENTPAGVICPNNPFQDWKLVQRIELNRRLLSVAIDAHRSMQIRGLDEDAPRVEVTLAYAYQRFLEDRTWQKPSNS